MCSSLQVEVKLIVDRGFMGQIVGKGGSHVTQIRVETGTSVNTTSPATRSPLVADAEQLITVCFPCNMCCVSQVSPPLSQVSCPLQSEGATVGTEAGAAQCW